MVPYFKSDGMVTGGNWKEMFHASESGDSELVGFHLKMGIDPNYQHPEYMTGALLESIRKGHLEVAKVLLEHGANPSIIKDFGIETPMSIAVMQGNKAAIYLLNDYLPEQERNKEVGVRKKILITGGNRGIGKATANKILAEGHIVVITVRKKVEGDSVIEELKIATKNPNVSFIQGDLSNIKNCNELIERIKKDHPDLNVLINNAGVFKLEKEINSDGLEMSFMVNYLAPYLLSKGLFQILKKNAPSRIINVNSGMHTQGKIDIEKTPTGLDFGIIRTYANSKMGNIMFTIDFAKEIEESGVTINAVHPGVANTNIGNSTKLMGSILKFIKRFWKSPDYAADAPSWLAINKKFDKINGKLFNKRQEQQYINKVKNELIRNRLKEKTEELLK